VPWHRHTTTLSQNTDSGLTPIFDPVFSTDPDFADFADFVLAPMCYELRAKIETPLPFRELLFKVRSD